MSYASFFSTQYRNFPYELKRKQIICDIIINEKRFSDRLDPWTYPDDVMELLLDEHEALLKGGDETAKFVRDNISSIKEILEEYSDDEELTAIGEEQIEMLNCYLENYIDTNERRATA